MEKSDSIKQLTVALIKAQAELKVVGKEAENSYFKSKYADLPAIFKEYQRVFPKHGLAVTQIPEGAGLRTTLVHDSGEWISGLANLLLVKPDPQGQGSAITYMRRYAMASICGIVSSDDDDDGNAGSHNQKPATARPEAKEAAPESIEGVGKIDKRGAKNKGGFIPYTLLGVRMVDGTDIKFTSKDQGMIDLMDTFKESKDTIRIKAQKTAFKGYADILSVSIESELPF